MDGTHRSARCSEKGSKMSGYPICQNLGLLVLRVSFGCLMMLGHGLPKLMNFGQMSESFPDPIGLGKSISLSLAIFAEFGCGLLLILGLLTRLATIPLITTMAVAALLVHGSDPWQKQEMAVVYLAAFVSILVAGGGLFSLDAVLRSWFFRERKN